MEFIKRHHDMDMGSSSSMAASVTSMVMDMASSTVMDMASSTVMDMASSTAMDMATSTAMDMATSTSSSMSGMKKMSMHMWLTAEFEGYPVLFKSLIANTKAQAFGIFVLLFVVAFLTRMLEFVRNYLEEIVWKNNNFLESEQGIVQHNANLAMVPSAAEPLATCCMNAKENGNFEEHFKSCCSAKKINNDADSSIDKVNSPQIESIKPKGSISLASTIMRDIIRLALCIIPDLLAYSLMLVAMTYTLVYFFAVVIGSGIGRFAAERTMEHFRIKRGPPRDCC